MSDALPLAPRPDLEQYKKLAKDLQHACRSAHPAAIREWALRWLERLTRHLRDAGGPAFPENVRREAARVEARWRDFTTRYPADDPCRLTSMQFFVAREHGFDSWQKFVAHIEEVNQSRSPVSNFEAAAEAIVNGDIETVRRLLREDPGLVRARSTRDHRSTLLHYVSANGIEDFRQKTPPNILEITQVLLEAGADVNAESEAYGGRSTTLGLTATSYHPEHAGVQVDLIELLVRHGANVDGPDSGSGVNACLHNGRGEAAAYLASLNARLDLEGAAGVGRLDIVETFFDEQGSLRPPATVEQMKSAFAMACQFGRSDIVRYLLDRGVRPDDTLGLGETGLHWAAYSGHADAVRLLLERGAPVGVVEPTYGGTPQDWALYAWGGAPAEGRERYYEAVELLTGAGARLDPEWYSPDEERRRALSQVQADPRMMRALNLIGGT
jgi:ankyrin repeat protein